MAKKRGIGNGDAQRMSGSDRVRRVLQAEASRRQHLLNLQKVYAEQRHSFLKAANIRAEVIQDPRFATELTERHHTLNRTSALLAAVEKAEQQDYEPLKRIRALMQKFGAFIETHYSHALESARLQSHNWVIAHAEGSKVDQVTQKVELPQKFAADIQVHIPDDVPDAKVFFEFPDTGRGDMIHNRPLLTEIQANQAAVGCVSDIGAEDDYAGLGLASAARAEAFRHIIEKVNPTRDVSRQIRYIVAAIFNIKGIQKGNERTVFPPDLQISNKVSLIMHLRSNTAPAVLGWTLVDREVLGPTEDDPQKPQTKIITDWDVVVHDLKNLKIT